MKLPKTSYRAIALIAIAVSVMGCIMGPASAAGISPSGTYMQGHHYGGKILNNQTLISAAAQTLGVSAGDLTTALTPPAQGRFNLTNAAAQLSATSGITITPAQLMAALGMHTGQMRTGAGQGQHFGENFLGNQTLISAAAQTLGVSVSDLTTALTPPAQGHFNLTNAAATLSTTSGITITPAQLMAALGMHQGQMRTGAGQGQHYGGNFLTNQTLITAAAQTLGVSVSDLTAALTPPAQGHFNLTNAAATLSTTSGITITPAQLMAALGMHQGGMMTSNQWAQGGSFRSHHANFGNRTAWHTSSGTSVPGSS